MKLLLVVCLVFAACGSGGGDSKVEEGAVTVEPNPVPQANLYCEHNGDLFRNTNGVAEPVGDEVESVEEVLVEDALGQVTKKKAITINGAVNIVAECGSDVTFNVNNTEDNSVNQLPAEN